MRSALRRAACLAVTAFAFAYIISGAEAAAPFVRLNLPYDGVVGGSPTNMPFFADAFPNGGVVKQVIFLVSGSVIATCSNSPYSATWTNTMPGYYRMQAAAMDDSGNWATSAVASVTLYTPPVYDLTLDNLATNVVFSGQWSTGNVNYAHVGPDYRIAAAVSGDATAVVTYTPIIPSPGLGDVFAFIPTGPSPSTNSPWTVQFEGGVTNVVVDEARNGGNWILIASQLPFQAGTNAHVLISNNSGELSSRGIMADALRFVASTPPFILKQPATNVVVGAGIGGSLTVTANGSMPFCYQ